MHVHVRSTPMHPCGFGLGTRSRECVRQVLTNCYLYAISIDTAYINRTRKHHYQQGCSSPDQKLTWPFHAMFILTFVNPSGSEEPYEVTGQHTWTSPSDESSMQFKACMIVSPTKICYIKYVQDDNTLHLHIHDHRLDQ